MYLCGATGARRSRVWSDHSRIVLESVFHCDLQLYSMVNLEEVSHEMHF